MEEQLGYNPLIADIKNTLGSNISVLDYGCGGGKVSRRLVQSGITTVIGVDISETMISKANTHPERGNNRFQKIDSGVLPFADNTFDAAICCFVFITNSDKTALFSIAKEVFRTLKNGALLFILDINPSSVGIQFSSFKIGETGEVYVDGSPRTVYLNLPNGDTFKIIDTHWGKQTYLDILQQAGFVDIKMFEHRVGDVPAGNNKALGEAECKWAPLVMFKSRKI